MTPARYVPPFMPPATAIAARAQVLQKPLQVLQKPVQTISDRTHGLGAAVILAAIAAQAAVRYLTPEQKEKLGSFARSTVAVACCLVAMPFVALMNQMKNPVISTEKVDTGVNFIADYSYSIMAGLGINYVWDRTQNKVFGKIAIVTFVVLPLFFRMMKETSNKGSDTHEVGKIGDHVMRYMAKVTNVVSSWVALFADRKTTIGKIANVAVSMGLVADLARDIVKTAEGTR